MNLADSNFRQYTRPVPQTRQCFFLVRRRHGQRFGSTRQHFHIAPLGDVEPVTGATRHLIHREQVRLLARGLSSQQMLRCSARKQSVLSIAAIFHFLGLYD